MGDITIYEYNNIVNSLGHTYHAMLKQLRA